MASPRFPAAAHSRGDRIARLQAGTVVRTAGVVTQLGRDGGEVLNTPRADS
jgi:hypothetical protein